MTIHPLDHAFVFAMMDAFVDTIMFLYPNEDPQYKTVVTSMLQLLATSNVPVPSPDVNVVE